MYLENEGFQVDVEHDGVSGLAAARDGDYVLVVLDLMLPRLPGTDVCRALRKERNVPILMLTARTTEDDRIQGLESGADDYVAKPFSPREVVARVRAVLRRTEHPELGGREQLLFDGLTLDLVRRRVEVHGEEVLLTPAELALLATLARAPGRVFSRETLAERSFGEDFRGTSRNVDVHVMNLRRKIERDRSRPEFIETVFGEGYRFAGRRR
ncbi:hypothetical protein ABI59_11505 [Acidobacteria bacterium Mor1]|nr:hypothetical protein ABI59_11505 [Acidobacteria bacterium Mor1]